MDVPPQPPGTVVVGDTADRDQLVARVAVLMRQLGRRVREHLADRIEGLGLTMPVAAALHHLDRPRAMSDLAGCLACDASYITGLADRLEERGWAERRPDPQDRRVKQIVLTASGRSVKEAVEAEFHRGHPMLAGLDNDELAELGYLLEKALGQE